MPLLRILVKRTSINASPLLAPRPDGLPVLRLCLCLALGKRFAPTLCGRALARTLALAVRILLKGCGTLGAVLCTRIAHRLVQGIEDLTLNNLRKALLSVTELPEHTTDRPAHTRKLVRTKEQKREGDDDDQLRLPDAKHVNTSPAAGESWLCLQHYVTTARPCRMS